MISLHTPSQAWMQMSPDEEKAHKKKRLVSQQEFKQFQDLSANAEVEMQGKSSGFA